MSDERQELEDLCVDSETCEREADTEMGEKPCIGCNDFAVASNDADSPPADVVDIADEDTRQEEIRTEVAAALKLLDKATEMLTHHKERAKSAKDSVERHEARLIELAREATTKPEATLWNHPDVEVTFDPVAAGTDAEADKYTGVFPPGHVAEGVPEELARLAAADDLETGHPHVAAADPGLGSAIWTCDSCGHKEAQADLRIEDEGRSYECSNCTSINTMMCEVPPDDGSLG